MLDAKDLELIAGVITKAIEPVNQRLDVIEGKLVEFDSRLSNVEADLVVVKERVTMLEDNVININSRLSTLESNVMNINTRLSEVEIQVRKANLNLENEVRYGIRAIADGHFSCFRNWIMHCFTLNQQNVIMKIFSCVSSSLKVNSRKCKTLPDETLY